MLFSRTFLDCKGPDPLPSRDWLAESEEPVGAAKNGESPLRVLLLGTRARFPLFATLFAWLPVAGVLSITNGAATTWITFLLTC